jgi:WD40 repeat protein
MARLRRCAVFLLLAGVSALAQAPDAPQPRTLIGNTSSVQAVAFSPDARLLATANSDHMVTLWDVATGQQVNNLEGHTGPVTAVAFSPDGRRLASGGEDHAIKLWDITAATARHTLTGHTDRVNSLAFSPDGKLLASAADDHAVKLWDAATGNELRSFTGHTNRVFAVAFSPDGKLLASASDDYSIRLWDVASGQQTQRINYVINHSDRVFSLAFSPDGKLLAAGCFDHTVKLWDVATAKPLPALVGHTDAVTSVAFAPDGRLASASWDHTVRLWDTSTAQQTNILRGHSNMVFSVAFSPDGVWLASAGAEPGVRLWPNGASLEIHTDPAAQVQLNGELKGVADATGALTLISLRPGHYKLQAQLAPDKVVYREMDINAGDKLAIPMQITRVALKEPEIEDALRKGLPPTRMAELVKQYGVDFALTPRLEQRLRSAGADADLLAAITASKR